MNEKFCQITQVTILIFFQNSKQKFGFLGKIAKSAPGNCKIWNLWAKIYEMVKIVCIRNCEILSYIYFDWHRCQMHSPVRLKGNPQKRLFF